MSSNEHKLGRAVYTGCNNGVNFYGQESMQKGQQIFSTSGNEGLTRSVVSFLERMIGEDVYRAGRRPYLRDAYRYVINEDVSAVINYNWLSRNETGSRDVGLAKALIGRFDKHPIRYLSAEFFAEHFFSDYFNANEQKSNEYAQLLQIERPPFFLKLDQNDLLKKYDFNPGIKFEDAGAYVCQPGAEHIAKQVRAAVCHLVKQFAKSESERKGIIIKGDYEQIRFTIAAICYAFSARDAKRIPFSISLPQTQFPYHFTTDAITGWNVEDPESMKAEPPSNMIFIESLVEVYKQEAYSHEYFNIISKFDPSHIEFIKYIDEQGKDIDISKYPDEYYIYITVIENKNKAIAERIQKEKEAEAERLQKEKEAEAEAERLRKEKEAEAEAERLRKEKEAETEAERLRKEKEAEAEAERLRKEKEAEAEAERLRKEKEAEAEAYNTIETVTTPAQRPSDVQAITSRNLNVPTAQNTYAPIEIKAPIIGVKKYQYGTYYGCIEKESHNEWEIIPHGWGIICDSSNRWMIGEWKNGKLDKGFVHVGFLIDKVDYLKHEHKRVESAVRIIKSFTFKDGMLRMGDVGFTWGAVCEKKGDTWRVGQWKKEMLCGWGIEFVRPNFRSKPEIKAGMWDDDKFITPCTVFMHKFIR